MAVVSESLKGRHFTRVADWGGDELVQALDFADDLKELQHRREEHHLLPGRALGMIFQKPSTRTRVSFEVGIAQLGGHGLYLAASDLQLGRGETLRDTATVLSRYLDGLMIRTFAQEDVEELARHATIPVINGLTDSTHPCQALADVMTIRERFDPHALEPVEALADRHHVGERLARVRAVGEAVDHRDRRVARQLLHVLLREGADHQAVEVAREDSGRVAQRLPTTELEVGGGEVEAVPAELGDADLERDA